jgi:hypothetical protein
MEPKVKYYIQGIFIGLFLLTGINSYSQEMLFTSIDILRPAMVNFPKEIDEILIINNTYPQPHDYGHKTYISGNAKKVTINTDSIQYFALISLAESIDKQDFFRNVRINLNSVNNKGYFFIQNLPADSLIRDISIKENAKAIISLNRMMVNDIQGDVFNNETGKYVAYLEAVYESSWSVHFPSLKQKSTLTIRDTVYWESESITRDKAIKGLPNRRNALIDGSMVAGERAVKKFIPYWDKVDRYIFTSTNKQIAQAIDSVYLKNWKGAIDVLENLLATNKGTATQKYKTCHNLAVLYEISGDVKNAFEYSKKALEHISSAIISDYAKIITVANYYEELRKRVGEVEKINKQLGE